MADSIYRACVLGVFTNDRGQVLVGERRVPRGAWQFPQGGIDPGESPEAAVLREMREELGCRNVEVLAKAPSPVRYEFPSRASVAKGAYVGQEQVWFLLRFPAGDGPDLAKAKDDEFVDLAWVTPDEALARIVDFKKSAYVLGLKALGLTDKVS